MAMWPWANPFLSLGLNFLTYKRGFELEVFGNVFL